jgi:hypothetical protein
LSCKFICEAANTAQNVIDAISDLDSCSYDEAANATQNVIHAISDLAENSFG